MAEWLVEEPFDTDHETGGDRLEFNFSGLTQHPLSLDPAEFKGMTVPTITDAIRRLMSGIAPGVSFFSEDLELAANEVAGANGENTSE